MNTLNKISYPLTLIAMLAIAVAVALPFFLGPESMAAKYVLTTGAALLLLGRLIAPRCKDKDFRVRRLCAMEKWIAILFCVAAYFMWQSNNPREWIVFILAGGFLQLYISVMLPRARRQALEQQANNSPEKQ